MFLAFLAKSLDSSTHSSWYRGNLPFSRPSKNQSGSAKRISGSVLPACSPRFTTTPIGHLHPTSSLSWLFVLIEGPSLPYGNAQRERWLVSGSRDHVRRQL